MNALILATFSVFTFQALAAGDAGYDCIGKNSVTNESVALELRFADPTPEFGYASKTVTIKKVGAIALDQPVILQMVNASKRNECQKTEDGQIYMSGGIDMTPTREGDLADFTIDFKSYCGDRNSKQNFDVKAYCIFQH